MELYHPASRERAKERVTGVSIHGLCAGSAIEPMVDIDVVDDGI